MSFSFIDVKLFGTNPIAELRLKTVPVSRNRKQIPESDFPIATLRLTLLFSLALSAACSYRHAFGAQPVEFNPAEHHIEVLVGGRPFTVYSRFGRERRHKIPQRKLSREARIMLETRQPTHTSRAGLP